MPTHAATPGHSRRTACLVTAIALVLAMFIPLRSQAEIQPVREYSIVVQEKTLTLLKTPHKQVTVWAYGLEGQEATVPGPVIRVRVGERLRVRFKNTHTLPHTIHFHGSHPFVMDGNGQRDLGTEQVQMPGEVYTYEFVAQEPGYYLYHCHFDTPNHMDHGMYGFFIVEDPAWPTVDQEWLTVWDEWDVDGDGTHETHTINSRSSPDVPEFRAAVGERVRLVMANVGFDSHSPHLHGQVWQEVDTGHVRTVRSTNHHGVVSLAPAELKVVEFMPRHEGTWLFHCHVLPHVNDDRAYPRGMLSRLIVGAPPVASPPRHTPAAPAAPPARSSLSSREPDTAASPQELAAIAPTSGNGSRGASLFGTHCAPCHGLDGRGAFGPKLSGNPILHEDERYWGTVLNGRGNMPAWKERLRTQDLADIRSYLQALD